MSEGTRARERAREGEAEEASEAEEARQRRRRGGERATIRAAWDLVHVDELEGRTGGAERCARPAEARLEHVADRRVARRRGRRRVRGRREARGVQRRPSLEVAFEATAQPRIQLETLTRASARRQSRFARAQVYSPADALGGAVGIGVTVACCAGPKSGGPHVTRLEEGCRAGGRQSADPGSTRQKVSHARVGKQAEGKRA